MTNLEHLIENTLIRFENGESADEILAGIYADHNYPAVEPTAKEIYEICQYVWCTYLDNGHRLVDTTNGYKLIKEHPAFVARYLAKACDEFGECESCPMYETGDCGNEEEIEKWLKEEKK